MIKIPTRLPAAGWGVKTASIFFSGGGDGGGGGSRLKHLRTASITRATTLLSALTGDAHVPQNAIQEEQMR